VGQRHDHEDGDAQDDHHEDDVRPRGTTAADAGDLDGDPVERSGR
jgi:hypothetical protein